LGKTTGLINRSRKGRINSWTDRSASGNNVPCTMCGGACVYIMLPKQRKYEKEEKKLQQAE